MFASGGVAAAHGLSHQVWVAINLAFPEPQWRAELLSNDDDGHGCFKSGACYVVFCRRLIAALGRFKGFRGTYGDSCFSLSSPPHPFFRLYF